MKSTQASAVRRPSTFSQSLAAALTFALICGSPQGAQAEALFDFQEGDRVALIGTTVLERDYNFGHLETALTLASGDKRVTFRNLSWSGDTVFGDARSYFGPPKEGLERLSELLKALQPTVVMLCYGTDLAHEPGADLEQFLEGYAALIQLVRSSANPRAILILSPPPLENLGPPLPSQDEANARLAVLNTELERFASAQEVKFVDWFGLMGAGEGLPEYPGPLTENGIHYSPDGYRVLASALVRGLGLSSPQAGRDVEPLRQAILAKNELFFHRWRPANETYLHGFRKHEQGQNAAELLEFEPMVAAKDAEIHALKTGTNP